MGFKFKKFKKKKDKPSSSDVPSAPNSEHATIDVLVEKRPSTDVSTDVATDTNSIEKKKKKKRKLDKGQGDSNNKAQGLNKGGKNKNPPQVQNAPKPKPPGFENIIGQDHCETPLQAYEDIAPILDILNTHLAKRDKEKDAVEAVAAAETAAAQAVAPQAVAQTEVTTTPQPTLPKALRNKSSRGADRLRGGRSAVRIYDPYFCTGRMKQHLARLGFDDVYNENVDCYKAWAVLNGTTGTTSGTTGTSTGVSTTSAGVSTTTATSTEQDPKQKFLNSFDVLVTNPPYSGDHILRLLAFVRKHLQDKLVLLNLPNWVYTKYSNLCKGCLFVVPERRYSFDAPEFAGRRSTAPVITMWYLMNVDKVLGMSEMELDEKVRGLGMLKSGVLTSGVLKSGMKDEMNAGEKGEEKKEKKGLFGGSSGGGLFGGNTGGGLFGSKTGGGLFAPKSTTDTKTETTNETTAETTNETTAETTNQTTAEMSAEVPHIIVTRENLEDWLKPAEDPTRKKMSIQEKIEKRETNKTGQKGCHICGQVYGNCKHTRGKGEGKEEKGDSEGKGGFNKGKGSFKGNGKKGDKGGKNGGGKKGGKGGKGKGKK